MKVQARDYLKEEIIKNENCKNKKLAEEIYSELGSKERTSAEAIAFIITGLNFLYKNKKDFSKKDLKNIITDGKNDKEIDVINITDECIDIFDFSNDDPGSNQMITLKNSIEEYVINKPNDFNVFNNRLKNQLIKIHSSGNTKKAIRLFVIRNSDWKSGGVKMKELENSIKSTKNGEFYFFNKEKLVQKITEPENYYPEWNIPMNPNEKINHVSDDKKEALLRIPLKHLLVFKKENDKLGLDLFNKNVRIFLDNKNLSKQIKSVVDNEPEMFSTYHNGILITTPNSIERGPGCVIIEWPQIVNGAQTINSLYEKFKRNLKSPKLEKAKIICKIIVSDKDLTNKVCETSNTQIPIKPWDLRANDDIQLILEKIIDSFSYNNKNYYYSRKGNKNKKGRITINLAEFIQWIYSIKSGDPAYAKNNKKYLFDIVSRDGKYEEIEKYLKEIKPEKIKKLCDTATFVKYMIKKQKGNGLLRDANIHIITAMYIKNKLSEKDFEKMVNFIEKYVEKIRGKNPKITNNKIFTKDKKIWSELLKNI